MNDRRFLTWLHERLEHVHGEDPRVDYMHRLRSIIAATPEGPEEVATLWRDGSVDYCILLCAPCRRELFPDVAWEDEKEGGKP